MVNLFVMNHGRIAWNQRAAQQWRSGEALPPPSLTVEPATAKCWSILGEMHDMIMVSWETTLGTYWRYKCPTCGWESLTHPSAHADPPKRR